MKKIYLLGISSLIMMCNSPAKEEQIEDNPNLRKTDAVIEKVEQPEEDTLRSDILDYNAINNPDTALAYFLYTTYKNFDPNQYQEEYQRLDLEFDKQIDLVNSIFANKQDLDDAIESINSNRNTFIKYIRTVVYSDYKEFNGVSGMSFSFLLSRKDSIVEPLLKELLNNEQAPQPEKEYATKILKEHFQD